MDGDRPQSLLREFFGRLATALTFGVGVILALLTFVVPDVVLTQREKWLVAALLFTGSIGVSLYILLLDMRNASSSTAGLRNVLPGTHYYAGSVVLLLDRNPSFESDQILTLFVREHDANVPLAILRIDTFTTDGYPQAVVLTHFTGTGDELREYLSDRSRWRALYAGARVKESYIKRGSS